MQGSVREYRSSGKPVHGPDPNQERAIRHTAGPAQIVAGPGSGKTYVIVQRIRYLITKCHIDPSRILVITFTKAAALEMQERFFGLTEPERPPVHFGTFHAVFYHILKGSTQYRDYSIITEAERKRLFGQIVHMHKRFACVREEDMDELAGCVGAYRRAAALQTTFLQQLTQDDIAFLAKEYEAYLREFRQTDFDGIVYRCRELLQQQPAYLALWQSRFSYILIDEFQDISPDQYEIMSLLARPDNNLFVVGDDDQAIYGFRGASPDSMQTFMRDHPDAVRIFLDVNFRCNERIVDAAGKVISRNRNRVAKDIRAIHGEGAGFHIHIAEREEEQERYLAAALEQKRVCGELDNCALICRTNYDCVLWAQKLRGYGIPYSIKGKPQTPFGHFVIRDVMAYLALADGRLLRSHFLRILNRPVRYLRRECTPDAQVSREAVLAYYRETPALQETARRLFDDLAALKGKRPHLQIHYICKVIGYEGYLRDKYGPDKAEELLGILRDFRKTAERFASYAALDDYISQCNKEIQCEKRPARQNAGTEENAAPGGVHLMTMHASKGLEFDTVYLPDCQEGKIPSARSNTEAQIEEERRMFYVAMTRAKRELCVTAYKGKSGKDMPSRFLQCLCQSSDPSPTNSSNSAASRYSSKASATASYSSSSSMYPSSGSSLGSSGFSL